MTATIRARIWKSRNHTYVYRWTFEVRDGPRLIMCDRRVTQQSALAAACRHIRLQADLNAEPPQDAP